MDLNRFEKLSDFVWRLPAEGPMRVPGLVFATDDLIAAMDDKVGEQIRNVASLPGIVGASLAMPDAHWGYGFPIGGVAAFDADEGGVVSAGGVGFDISCGVRTLHTGLTSTAIERVKDELADTLYDRIPVGVGSGGRLHLDAEQMDAMLAGGAQWAVEQGFGTADDLVRIEEGGAMPNAEPARVSQRAKQRQQREMGSLGSGNHYLEVQRVAELFDPVRAAAFGLAVDDVVISIHCGSRGLGHQIGTEFLKEMVLAARAYEITLPDRELACAPLDSPLGRDYLGAMRAAINCALANRQILTHFVREAVSEVLPDARLELLYDVSHNTCKEETHVVAGRARHLYVHRKGATRALGPGHPDVPEPLRAAGQPVLIGGSMGTCSYVLAGADTSAELAFSSACHGAGRSMSRHEATRRWRGQQVVKELGERGIVIRSPSARGVAEEAPGAYKDVTRVVEAAEHAGLASRVARLDPLVCVKG